MIKKIICKLGIHDFLFVKGTHNKYYECKWCKNRKVYVPLYGYQPIDKEWLKINIAQQRLSAFETDR